MGCGGGLVVSVLAFYSDDPSSIPAEVYNFFCKIVVENNENKQKEAGVLYIQQVICDCNNTKRRWLAHFLIIRTDYLA